MDYKITMNTAKVWNSIKKNASLLIDTYYNDPELFEFGMKLDETKMLVIRIAYMFMIFLLLTSIIRTCMDPFSVKLHKHISELEERLTESENQFEEVWKERKNLETENNELKELINILKNRSDTLESRYLCCRQAAQNFLNVNPNA
jgi:septal ring factor EnvC (AmiA/AmiB activator)